MTAPIDRIVRSRVAYERLLKRVAVLERKLRARETELRELGARMSPHRRGVLIKEADAAEVAARATHCEECGAGVNEPCRYPSDQTRPRAHHLRGRKEACGKDGCWECRRAFVDGYQERGT